MVNPKIGDHLASMHFVFLLVMTCRNIRQIFQFSWNFGKPKIIHFSSNATHLWQNTDCIVCYKFSIFLRCLWIISYWNLSKNSPCGTNRLIKVIMWVFLIFYITCLVSHFRVWYNALKKAVTSVMSYLRWFHVRLFHHNIFRIVNYLSL